MSENVARLVAEVMACRVCAVSPLGSPLTHAPRPVLRISETARICVVGQAPGTRVHASGIPFSDPSGVRLRDWMDVTPDEFYDSARVAIVPMGFCFPGLDAKGSDLPPRRECAPLWRARIFAALPRLELVLLAGRHAQAWHLGADNGRTLTETVRDWRRIADIGRPRRVPLPHPSWRNNAWLTANPWFAAELLPELRAETRRCLGGNAQGLHAAGRTPGDFE